LLAIEAGREERGLPAAAGSKAKRALRENLVKLSREVHALSYRLHPSILEELGLLEALKSEWETFSRRELVRVAVVAPGISEKLPHDVSLGLFRVAQEALRNVGRHARANRVEVIFGASACSLWFATTAPASIRLIATAGPVSGTPACGGGSALSTVGYTLTALPATARRSRLGRH
jgi:hypothetical protein